MPFFSSEDAAKNFEKMAIREVWILVILPFSDFEVLEIYSFLKTFDHPLPPNSAFLINVHMPYCIQMKKVQLKNQYLVVKKPIAVDFMLQNYLHFDNCKNENTKTLISISNDFALIIYL